MAQICLNLDAQMMPLEFNSSVFVPLPIAVTTYLTKAIGGERVYFSSWFNKHSIIA